MTEQTKVKSNAFHRGLRTVIVLAVLFALLIIGYFAILRPYLEKKQSDTTEPVEMIWAQEVASINNRMLIYEHIPRDQISKIEIHNPGNVKYGDRYIDWGFYRYTGETDDESGMTKDSFYLTGYEYAPYDQTVFASLITATGYTLATSRIEDHCTDFSKYGLDYATPEDAVSVTLTTTDGRVYTYFIGDKTPSGTGYYVRCMNSDTLLSTGEEMQRDSVYVFPAVSLEDCVLATPQKMVDPYLTIPVDTTTAKVFDEFAIWRYEDKYLVPELDEDGNQKYTEDGVPIRTWKPMIHMRPIKNKKDDFALFNGLSVYYAVVPSGYFGSGYFENLISLFSEFKGYEVMELGEIMIDSEGEEIIGFEDGVFEKYGLDDSRYILEYKFSGDTSCVYFSEKQTDSTGNFYYAYSERFNIIAKVAETSVYFLDWTPENFIQRQIGYMQIDDVRSVSISGSYFDLGITRPDRQGEVTVDETFELTDTGSRLVVTDSEGAQINTTDFRQFFLLVIRGTIREEVSAEQIEEAMKNEPMATLSVTSRRKTVYKTDSEGNATSNIDYVLEPATKIYRYYELSNGRVLCTIENIDSEGESQGEKGNFYMLTSQVKALLSAAVDLTEGISVDGNQRV